MESLLSRKARYFFSTHYRSRSEIRESIASLCNLGRVAVVGGLLRDLALFGNREFCSDVDLVIDPFDADEFNAFVLKNGGIKNRFGGYALPGSKWKIDVWALEATWAHVNGHVEVRSLEDIKETTFFTCDAIIYDMSDRRLKYKQGYFDNIQDRILNINLKPNPNPLGNAVRAFRYALSKNMRWGSELTLFIAGMIENSGWKALCDYEMKSFRTSYIELLDKQKVKESLENYISLNSKGDFCMFKLTQSHQFSLPSLGDGSMLEDRNLNMIEISY